MTTTACRNFHKSMDRRRGGFGSKKKGFTVLPTKKPNNYPCSGFFDREKQTHIQLLDVFLRMMSQFSCDFVSKVNVEPSLHSRSSSPVNGKLCPQSSSTLAFSLPISP